jgi:hypothetical protein
VPDAATPKAIGAAEVAEAIGATTAVAVTIGTVVSAAVPTTAAAKAIGVAAPAAVPTEAIGAAAVAVPIRPAPSATTAAIGAAETIGSAVSLIAPAEAIGAAASATAVASVLAAAATAPATAAPSVSKVGIDRQERHVQTAEEGHQRDNHECQKQTSNERAHGSNLPLRFTLGYPAPSVPPPRTGETGSGEASTQAHEACGNRLPWKSGKVSSLPNPGLRDTGARAACASSFTNRRVLARSREDYTIPQRNSSMRISGTREMSNLGRVTAPRRSAAALPLPQH